MDSDISTKNASFSWQCLANEEVKEPPEYSTSKLTELGIIVPYGYHLRCQSAPLGTADCNVSAGHGAFQAVLGMLDGEPVHWNQNHFVERNMSYIFNYIDWCEYCINILYPYALV